MGAVTILSKIFTFLSVGITMGPIEEELKRALMDISPRLNAAMGAFLPKANDRNMKSVKSMANMSVPGFILYIRTDFFAITPAAFRSSLLCSVPDWQCEYILQDI